ncbi:MAG: ornithine cyclodeaminase family protein [Gemmatimonadaceae bacterium]|nr:ornithine cyclodeaminase family protein [Gemmatimonadaceae bacterium]
MTTLLLTDRDVHDLLPMPACIDVMGDALRSVAEGNAVLPLRTVLRLGDTTNAFASMPAILGAGSEASLGAKIITVFPGNDATPFDSHIGVVLLFDAMHGTLLAIADASSITAIRTSAVSGLATRLLANEDASSVAILGAGVLALPHLEAMCAVRSITKATVWSRSGADQGSRAHTLAKHAREHLGIDVVACETVAEAVRGADIVCTITSSRTPVLEGRSLRAGTHVNAVGASMRTARELDSAAIVAARLFCDRRESALAESGDVLVPIAEGLITEAHLLGELGELVAQTISGRTSRDEITLFKSLGLAVEDVAALRYIHTRALDAGRGTPVELGGRRG